MKTTKASHLATPLVLSFLITSGDCFAIRKSTYTPSQKSEERQLRKIKSLIIKDNDGDGVLDHLDRCPTTKPDIRVNQFGCWRLGKT